MKLTKEEARLRICHRTLGTGTHRGTYCIASECLAWRWASPAEQKRYTVRPRRPGMEDADPTHLEAYVPPKDCRIEAPEPRPAEVPASWAWHPPTEAPRRFGAATWQWGYFLQPTEEAQAERPGYCGLAGFPDPAPVLIRSVEAEGGEF